MFRKWTQHAEVILTVVSDDAAMAAIYETPGDHLFQNAAGKLFINCATITPATHIHLQQLADSVGAAILECPMASSITQAREGTLYLMCAGRKETYQRAQPILDALASTKNLYRRGGNGCQFKSIGQYGHEYQYGGLG